LQKQSREYHGKFKTNLRKQRFFHENLKIFN
jgi:hypothetical protein